MKFFMVMNSTFRSLYNLKIAIEECIKQYYTQKNNNKIKRINSCAIQDQSLLIA